MSSLLKHDDTLIIFPNSLEPDQASWKMCFQLYLQAFREPKSAPDQKKLARILKKPLNPDVEKDLFDYDSFLRGLGRMSLSMPPSCLIKPRLTI